MDDVSSCFCAEIAEHGELLFAAVHERAMTLNPNNMQEEMRLIYNEAVRKVRGLRSVNLVDRQTDIRQAIADDEVLVQYLVGSITTEQAVAAIKSNASFAS